MNDEFPPSLEAAMIRTNTIALSWPERVRYVALLLTSLGIGIILVALLLTEPELPGRTMAAFAVMVAIAAGWVALATWVLTSRRPLYSRHRVVASQMAVGFSALFTAGAFAVAWAGGGAAALFAGATGLLLTLVAAGLLLRARQRVRELENQRNELAREIAGRAA